MNTAAVIKGSILVSSKQLHKGCSGKQFGSNATTLRNSPAEPHRINSTWWIGGLSPLNVKEQLSKMDMPPNDSTKRS